MRRIKRKQKTTEQLRRRASRRQRFFRAVGRTLFLGLLLAAGLLAMTIFFKVKTITVQGATTYSAEEVAAGLEVQPGDNLYLWNKVKVSDALLQTFPYLQTVQIRRRLPSTLEVTVTECTACIAVQSGSGYFLLSKQGKVLEQTTANNGLPVVVGMTLDGVQPGQVLHSDISREAEALLTVVQTMDAADMLSELDFINLTDLHDIRIGYRKSFDIRVGTIDNLAYHLRFAQTVIDERLSPSDIGRLYWDDQNRLHFVPDTADNVAKSGMATLTGSIVPGVGQTGTTVDMPAGTDDTGMGVSSEPVDGEDTAAESEDGAPETEADGV